MPDDVSAHLVHADAALELDQLDVAEQDYVAVLRATPDDDLAIIGLAWVQVRLERADEARRTLEPRLRRQPDDAAAIAIDAEALLLLGQRAAAVKRYREALAHAPEEWNFRERANDFIRGNGHVPTAADSEP